MIVTCINRQLGERAGCKGASQYLARFFRIESTGLQVEESGLVELANGRAVSALDVVSIDLEFGLGIDLRAVRQ